MIIGLPDEFVFIRPVVLLFVREQLCVYRENKKKKKITVWLPSPDDINPFDQLWSILKMKAYEYGQSSIDSGIVK